MKIVSLTTDYGETGFRAAALRGAILNAGNKEIMPIDISHCVQAFNIVDAAYVVRNSFRAFPQESVHIIAVEGQMPIAGRLLAYAAEGHFFIVPDNGILTLIFDTINAKTVYEVGLLLNHNYRERFARAAAHLALGEAIEEIGPLAEQFEERINMRPVVTQNRIRGTVIAVDSYQNIVTNIPKTLFEKQQKGRTFSIQIRRNDPIYQISPHYGAVHQGEPLCRWSSNGMLEVAVNLGRAAELLGIKEEDLVEIVFEETK